MELPKLQKPDKYVGLYIFDFGDHAGVGFTAEEVAELLESERFRQGKVYKIHRAHPDGRLELKGVAAETFQLEAGMFFYSQDLETARGDFKRLTDMAVSSAPALPGQGSLSRIRRRQVRRSPDLPGRIRPRSKLLAARCRLPNGRRSRGRHRRRPALLRRRHRDTRPTATVRRARAAKPHRRRAFGLCEAGRPEIAGGRSRKQQAARIAREGIRENNADSQKNKLALWLPCGRAVVAVRKVSGQTNRR